MDLVEAFEVLRKCDRPVPRPHRLPLIEDIREYEKRLNYRFPSDYIEFQLRASNVTCGSLEPSICLPNMDPYIDPYQVATDGWELGIPKEYLPFCYDEQTYYCISSKGYVHTWYADDSSFNGDIRTLTDWIVSVWVGGA